MTLQPVGYEDSDISLASGKLRVRRWGAADAPAVVCVPGLSANLCGFDRLAERLAGEPPVGAEGPELQVRLGQPSPAVRPVDELTGVQPK